MRSRIPGSVVLAAVCLCFASPLLAAAPFQLVSTADPAQTPAGGGGDSLGPVLSADGRYVLFASSANNLALLAGTNPISRLFPPRLNVFLRDRTNATTTLVSVNAAGTGGGNGDSFPVGISTNGRYACFESNAGDLVAGDTNGVTDVFVRDLLLGTNFLVSIATNGTAGNGVCRGSTMTPDGRYVAFVSSATSLVAGDTNGIPDVFVRDLQNNLTIIASAGALGTNLLSRPPNSSESPDITPDGRYVAFYSTATNLIPAVTTTGEIYVRDLVGGTTIWASAGARGASKTTFGTSNAVSCNHLVSADGNVVAYEVTTNGPSLPHGKGMILRYRSDTGLTDIVNTNAYAPPVPYEEFHSLDVSSDGRFIAFVANTNGTTDATTCILLWDAQTGNTTLVSGDLNNNIATNATCDSPAIDQSGRYVAFISNAPNLVTNSLVGEYHVYVRDVQAGVTLLVDSGMDGTGASVGPATCPRLSADGRCVAFEALDANLVPNDRNRDYDVFVRDLVASTTELISARYSTLPSLSPNGPSAISSYSVSDDGRLVAFASEADNLVASDTNAMRDIFVRDLRTGTNVLVSVNPNGVSANGISSDAAISGNGRFVAFACTANEMAPAKVNQVQDVYVRDLLSNATTLVSMNFSGVGGGDNNSYSPWISPDGSRVLFRSQAHNLISSSVSGTENLFLRDINSQTTYALTTSGLRDCSPTPDGRYIAFAKPSAGITIWDSQAAAVVWTNGSTVFSFLAISPAGNKIAFSDTSGTKVIDRLANTTNQISAYKTTYRNGLKFSRDERLLVYAAYPNPSIVTSNQVYLYDFSTGTNSLVSHAYGSSVVAAGSSDSPAISSDGRFVAFRSAAPNLLAAPVSTNGGPHVYLYDRLAGSMSLLTTNRLSGAPADNRSLTPVFSGDGRTLVFQSWASDVTAQDFNHSEDILALQFLYISVVPGLLGSAATITWPARPGESYQVQFKNALSENIWQTVAGSVTITNGLAQLIDTSATSAQRYYRVMAQ